MTGSRLTPSMNLAPGAAAVGLLLLLFGGDLLAVWRPAGSEVRSLRDQPAPVQGLDLPGSPLARLRSSGVTELSRCLINWWSLGVAAWQPCHKLNRLSCAQGL